MKRFRHGSQQWTTVRNVVELLVRAGVDEPAAVLFGALDVSGTAPPAFGVAAVRLATAGVILDHRLGPVASAIATSRGAALGDDEARRFALEALGRVGQQATTPA